VAHDASANRYLDGATWPVVSGGAGYGKGSKMAETCSHLGTVEDVTPSSNGCEDCLRTGGRWVHLRMCMRCGHVGCCDNSPNRHATAHWRSHHDHPLIRSFEPGEDWWWCYADELFFELADAPPALSHT